MLARMSIRDFAIAARVEIDFDSGFTVFTGETGAGKSILVDALAFVLGERADAGIVMAGAERAEVSAEFVAQEIPGFSDWLREADLEGDEGICLLRRLVDASGRSRAYVNGRSVTLQQLREAGEQLVDIHGQHAHQSLMKPGAQREMLDALAGAEKLAISVTDAYKSWYALRKKRLEFEQNRTEIDAQREALSWQVNELAQLAFDPEGWEETLREHGRLSHAVSLIETARSVLDMLSESEGACSAMLASADTRLSAVESFDPEIASFRPYIESAQIQIGEVSHALRRYADRLDLDPGRLAELESRIAAVQNASRKYRVPPLELADILHSARKKLAALDDAGDSAAMQAQENAAHAHYLELAADLSRQRHEMADKLSAGVTESMQLLSMTGGVFEARLEPVEEGDAHGLEKVEFQVTANAGMPLRPLAKVASGGELSRISLAIQVMGCRAQKVPTLIFDEVDVGIGGKVAEIVGRLLAQLGRERQVLCVTHLPQVASLANHQYSVMKSDGRSSVQRIEGGERIEEIARMLGGLEITETTRRHAREMLGNQSL